MPYWHPNPIPEEGDFLEWWVNEVKLSHGESIPQCIKDRSGHLTNKAAVIFRHIYYGHNVAKSKIASLANVFGALYYGRPLKDHETVSKRTIDNHMKKLDEYDSYCVSQSFKRTFVESKDQLYGFLRLWYSSTDDTKHGKSDNHHVVIRTGDYIYGKNDDGFSIDPFFDCLSSFQSVTKDTKGNVNHNVAVFEDACYGDNFVLGCYGGNTSDNPARWLMARQFKRERIKTMKTMTTRTGNTI